MEALLRDNLQSNLQKSPVQCQINPEGGLDGRSMQTDVQFATAEPLPPKHSQPYRNSVHARQGDTDSVDGLALITFRDEEVSAYFGEALRRSSNAFGIN